MTIDDTSRRIADALLGMKGMKLENMLVKLGEQFSDATQAQLERGFAIAQDELEARAKEHFDEAAALDDASEMYVGLPKGTTFEEAVNIKAENGDPKAIAIQAWLNSPEQRLHRALLVKALDMHPDWQRTDDGFKWIGKGSAPDGINETALIDWLQTGHPAVARDVERQIESAPS